MNLTIKGTITPVSTTRCIQLPWYIGSSYIKILRHLKDKKGGRYHMSKKINKKYFNSSSHLSRQLEYMQFYRR